jgi:hypothetical protein
MAVMLNVGIGIDVGMWARTSWTASSSRVYYRGRSASASNWDPGEPYFLRG